MSCIYSNNPNSPKYTPHRGRKILGWSIFVGIGLALQVGIISVAFKGYALPIFTEGMLGLLFFALWCVMAA